MFRTISAIRTARLTFEERFNMGMRQFISWLNWSYRE